MAKSVITRALHRVEVTEDLTSVTRYDPAQESNPEWVQMTQRSVDRIWSAVESLYRTGVYPAVAFCLRKHGEVVLNRTIGHASGNGPHDSMHAKRTLMTPQTPTCLFSISKAMTAMLVHKLAELREINLMDPVSYYMPGFGLNGKKRITVAQILCHKAGIPTIQNLQPELFLDKQEVMRLINEARPTNPTGRYMAYHALTGGYVLGALIETITGKSIRRYMREEIQEPMKCRYFNFGVERDDIDRVATNYVTGIPIKFPIKPWIQRILGVPLERAVELSNSPAFYEADIPAGNITSTAEEATRFFQMLLNEGVWDGRRYFEPVTVHRATQETGRPEVDRILCMPMRYSYGMMLGGNPMGPFGPMTPRAFGHIGFTNNLCWADPERDISVALLTTGNPVLGPHIPVLAKLLTTISLSCKRIYRDGHDY